MSVTIETTVDDPVVVEQFLDLYRSAFAPLDSLAAARQSLTDDEFRDEMREESVLKFVGWDRQGTPVAMCMLATDLSKLPWISPAFWQQRYPEQFARNAIFYVGAVLVSPSVKGSLWFRRLLLATVRHAASHHGVGALDVCRYNAEEINLPRIVAEVSAAVAEVEFEHVDTQSYYAYVYDGLKTKTKTSAPAEIDLRDPVHSTATPGEDVTSR
ncbi:MAG: hypothetical protein ACLFWR_01725 [Acidimicrobiales bacterium]